MGENSERKIKKVSLEKVQERLGEISSEMLKMVDEINNLNKAIKLLANSLELDYSYTEIQCEFILKKKDSSERAAEEEGLEE